ncbi:MAG: biotin--[acetyl-CoA-carboxylase] ligase [Actinomycetota bacterium]|nr:biotin--[acetyl-CoA-carboxylase] ligase [Actinomycetota bacterium]
MLSAQRVRHALVGTRFDDLRVVEEIDSTNRAARRLADDGTPEGLVIVADHQTAGRGRLGRRWEAPPGTSVLMSVLLRPNLAVADLHLVTAAVGLAARAACGHVGGFLPDLKWPNDLLVGEAKLAGILAEATLGAVVVGIGINVSTAPPGATCVDAVSGRAVGREAVMVALLADLDRRMRHWDRVIGDYRSACATVGRAVLVLTPDGELRGRAQAVDDQGRLLVISETGARVVVAAGDVVHVRPR